MELSHILIRDKGTPKQTVSSGSIEYNVFH